MNPLFRLAIGPILVLASIPSALAQASAWVGSWTMDVQGSARQRVVVISQDGAALRVIYGWKEPGAKIGPVEASFDPAEGMTMKTNAESVIVVKLTDDNTMRGQLTTREGKTHAATLVRSTAATPVAATVAGSQNTSPGTGAPEAATASLDKAAVESLVVGHKLTFFRHEDKNKVIWAIDKNGVLYGENLTQGSKDTARWILNDKAELCLKWKGNSKDGCRRFSVADDKTLMYDTSSPDVINATIEKVD